MLFKHSVELIKDVYVQKFVSWDHLALLKAVEGLGKYNNDS